MIIVTMTTNHGHRNGNNCVLDHLQDVDLSEGFDRDGGYNKDHKIMMTLMVILTFWGSYDHIYKIPGKLDERSFRKVSQTGD